MEGEYRLKRPARVQHWARVRVVVARAPSWRVLVSPGACLWLAESYGPSAVTDVPDDFKAAAESGATLALTLAQISEPLAVTVTRIDFTHADTTPDDVKAATFHAVFQAIGRVPASPPYIDADGIHFPSAADPSP